jgi:hypothetical protein
MKNRTLSLMLATLALCLSGCASSSIKQSWKSPDRQTPARKISVLAVDERAMVRVGLENRFVREMRRRNQDAVATRDLLGLQEIKDDKEAAAARLRDAGADTVLIVRLVDQATYNHQVVTTPGLHTPSMAGYPGYSWFDCFSYAYAGAPVVHSSTRRDIYLDSSLFDLTTGRRIWSALTLTSLKQDDDALVAADDLAERVVEALRKDGLIR